jgi:glycosyltransferase involved in cell wall biosynthesis
MINKKLPLISCISVTRKKSKLLKRAISCFSAQSYPNKELIIIYEDDDLSTEQFLQSQLSADSSIRFFCVPSTPKMALGELRNLAIELAKGEFICQWDDDDWYHVNRLSIQYEQLRIKDCSGSIMTQWLVFDTLTTAAYISNVRLWEGSILCKKSILQLKPYEHKPIGEDTATIDFLAELNHICLLDKLPGLYIYVYHGHNTWHYEHWKGIFRCSTPLSQNDSQIISDILEGNYFAHEGSLILDEMLGRFYSKNIEAKASTFDS